MESKLWEIRRKAADDAERVAVVSALRSHLSVRAAAEWLGVDRSNLRRSMKRLGIRHE